MVVAAPERHGCGGSVGFSGAGSALSSCVEGAQAYPRRASDRQQAADLAGLGFDGVAIWRETQSLGDVLGGLPSDEMAGIQSSGGTASAPSGPHRAERVVAAAGPRVAVSAELCAALSAPGLCEATGPLQPRNRACPAWTVASAATVESKQSEQWGGSRSSAASIGPSVHRGSRWSEGGLAAESSAGCLKAEPGWPFPLPSDVGEAAVAAPLQPRPRSACSKGDQAWAALEQRATKLQERRLRDLEELRREALLLEEARKLMEVRSATAAGRAAATVAGLQGGSHRRQGSRGSRESRWAEEEEEQQEQERRQYASELSAGRALSEGGASRRSRGSRKVHLAAEDQREEGESRQALERRAARLAEALAQAEGQLDALGAHVLLSSARCKVQQPPRPAGSAASAAGSFTAPRGEDDVLSFAGSIDQKVALSFAGSADHRHRPFRRRAQSATLPPGRGAPLRPTNLATGSYQREATMLGLAQLAGAERAHHASGGCLFGGDAEQWRLQPPPRQPGAGPGLGPRTPDLGFPEPREVLLGLARRTWHFGEDEHSSSSALQRKPSHRHFEPSHSSSSHRDNYACAVPTHHIPSEFAKGLVATEALNEADDVVDLFHLQALDDNPNQRSLAEGGSAVDLFEMEANGGHFVTTAAGWSDASVPVSMHTGRFLST